MLGRRAERRVREGFLERVNLKEPTEKTQGMPARRQPARLEARTPGETWGEGLRWCRRWASVKASCHLLHMGRRSLLPWDVVLLGFGPWVPPNSLF